MCLCVCDRESVGVNVCLRACVCDRESVCVCACVTEKVWV